MIKKEKCYFTSVLPIVYEDCLSYYEQLCKVINKLNEVIELYNGIKLNFDEYVNDKIQDLKTYVDDENEKQTEFFNAEMAELQKTIEKQIFDIYHYIQTSDEGILAEVNIKLSEIKKYIDSVVIDGIQIYNPIKGRKTNIQEAVNDTYDATRYLGIKALNYDSLNMGAEAYDNYHIKAIDFDVLSAKILGKIYEFYVFDYVTGAYETIQRVLYRLFQTVRPNAITATAYDSKSISTDTYDGLNITAFSFDDSGNTLLPSS